jgi:hypothetical protein
MLHVKGAIVDPLFFSLVIAALFLSALGTSLAR